MLESSLTFRHDRGARLGMLPATCERPRGLGQSERSGLRARARKRKWSVRYMLCPRVRNRGPWCFPRTVWIPITCFLTSQVEGFAISSPFCFVQPFEKRSLVGSLYLEIGGLRPSSHQKIRRSLLHGAPPHDPPVALDFGMERGFFVGRGIGVVFISQLHKNKKTWCFLATFSILRLTNI